MAAQPGQAPIEINVLQAVNLPEQSPRMKVTARVPIRELRIAVSEGGATVASRNVARLGPGGSEVITWNAEPGVHEYLIDLSGRTDDGPTNASSRTKVSVMRPVEIDLRKEEVDLGTRTLRFSINNPASRAQLAIYDLQGRTIHQAETSLEPSPAKAQLEVDWPPLEGSIGRLELRVFDTTDSWAGIELLPYAVEIPHVEVVFETASWTIAPSERSKLDAAYQLILTAIRDHGADLKASLYILGHTDTVGSEADNLALSKNRAMAIARYFMSKGGIALPILACGFGETKLAVQTGDSVDEARNRRAQYVLAAQEPVAGAWTVVGRGKK